MPSIAPPSHTRRNGITTDSWITPKWLLDRVGPFDFDPCACDPQPWPTAKRMITEKENGLLRKWEGVWFCNPPYGKALKDWLERCSMFTNPGGIALTFARTETRAFHRHVWPVASALLFLEGRVTFCTPQGSPAPAGHNSGGPSVLIAYGEECADRLWKCRDMGALVKTLGLIKPRQ